MSDDYLWSRRGPPDHEVEGLERALGGLRYRREAPEAPRPRVRARWVAFAAAAVLVLGLALALKGHLGTPPPEVRGPAWSLEVIDAASDVARRGTLATGEWLETGATHRARLDVADIGLLDVMPRSRLQLVATGEQEHRLRLERGAVHAVVTAPPRLFVVETPAADAVDLGCEYTLEVDERGNGRLEVTAGWVALEREGRAATVPRGAVCDFRSGAGPGTPYFADAPAPLRAALERLDARRAGSADLDTVVREARRRDTLTLFHLLPRFEGAQRERVYDRMAALVAPPPDVTRAGTLALDSEMLEIWFDELRWEAFGG